MAWGFMMGAGKGVSGFSAILGEKREESFKLKRDELQFERQKSLEELRAGNDRTLAEDKRKWADSRQDELLTRQEGSQVKGYDENGMEVTVGQFNAMDPDQQAKVIGKEDYKLKIKTANQDLDLANKLEMQKQFDDYKYDKAVEQRKIDADNVRKHLADENGYLDPWEELHAQGIEDGQDYVKMVNRGSAWTAEQIKEVNEWLASDETFAKIKDPDQRIEYTLKVAQRIFGKKNGRDLAGGKEKGGMSVEDAVEKAKQFGSREEAAQSMAEEGVPEATMNSVLDQAFPKGFETEINQPPDPNKPKSMLQQGVDTARGGPEKIVSGVTVNEYNRIAKDLKRAIASGQEKPGTTVEDIIARMTEK